MRAGSIGCIDTLGHDTFGAELASVLEHQGAILGEGLVEQDARLAPVDQPSQSGLAVEDTEQRRALAVLADTGRDGAAEAIMAARFGVEVLAGLVRKAGRAQTSKRCAPAAIPLTSCECGSPRQDGWRSRREGAAGAMDSVTCPNLPVASCATR